MLKSKYQAKKVSADGYADFTAEENGTWQILYKRQLEIIQNRACQEFIAGVEKLAMSADRVPQVAEITKSLQAATGWSVVPVPALIDVNEFFTLLANQQFPAATFIRRREELDYLEEPDLFHEYFGHCPLLTNQAYADFMRWYGEFALKSNEAERNLLARLFWFTIEFGLLKTKEGMRIFGGGILSSKNETVYAVESTIPERKAFVLADVLRTPYRIDIMQPIYFYLNNFAELYALIQTDLVSEVKKAAAKGDFVPAFMTC